MISPTATLIAQAQRDLDEGLLALQRLRLAVAEALASLDRIGANRPACLSNAQETLKVASPGDSGV